MNRGPIELSEMVVFLKNPRADQAGPHLIGFDRQVALVILSILLLVNAASLIALAENRVSSERAMEAPGMSRSAKEWTVFVYMCADNNLEDVGIADFNEMEMVGSGPNLNIVVQFDRISGHDSSNGDWTDTRRFLVEQDYDPNTINSLPVNSSLGELDMTDPDTLRDFLEWGVDSYPANRYMLVMWDHGSGLFRSRSVNDGENDNEDDDDDDEPTRGFCQDWTDGGDMKPWELSGVLHDLKLTKGIHFDIVAADVCYFAYIETAYQLRENVDYFIGSSDEEPAAGWNYQNALSYISEKPFSTTRDTAIEIVERYLEGNSQNYITQMALDIASMEGLLLPELESFTKTLISTAYHYQSDIESAKRSADRPRNEYVDLHSFIRNIEEDPDLPLSLTDKAASALTALEAAIVAHGTGSKHPNSRGLAIWFPENFMSNYHKTTYVRKFDFTDTAWDDFLKEYDSPTAVSIDSKPMADTENIDGPYLFEASVNAPEGSIGSVVLHYKLGEEGSFLTEEFEYTDDGYHLDLDAPASNKHIHYYIELILNDNTSYTDPLSADRAIMASLYRFWVGLDLIPPSMNHFPLQFITDISRPYTVSVTISDNMGVDANATYLKYMINTSKVGTPVTRVKMERVESSIFEADIPPQPANTDIYYWIEAQDISKSRNTARLPEKDCFRSTFVLERKSLLIDNAHDNDLRYTNITEEYLIENFELHLLDEPVTEDMLEEFDIFVTAGAEGNFSEDEITAVDEFLKSGGSALVIGSVYSEITTPLLDLGGMNWTLSFERNEGNTTNVNRSLDKFDYVDAVYYDSRLYSITGGDHEVLRSVNNEILTAYSNVGWGRLSAVVDGILSDGDITKEGDYIPFDNFEFARGLLRLLIENRHPVAVIELMDAVEVPGVLELGESYGFSGSNSFDPDGTIENYTWRLNGGTMGYGKEVAWTFTEPGRYDVNLHVKDAEDTWSLGSATFYANIPPTAMFKAALNVSGDLDLGKTSVKVEGGKAVHFTSTSTDVDGVITRTKWDFGDGSDPVESKDEVVHAFNRKGLFDVTLTIRDNNGISRSHSVLFEISNAPPVVVIEVQKRAKEDDTVHMSAYNSFDPNHDGKDFFSSLLWDFGDGDIQNYSLNVNHIYRKSGEYNITLYITDADPDNPLTGMDVFTLIIYNQQPDAKANFTEKKGATITFTGEESGDTASDHDLLEYSWDFGDGKTGKGKYVTHTYTRDGNFTVVLTVTDDDGANGTDLLLVNITSSRSWSINWFAAVTFVILLIILMSLWVRPLFGKKKDDTEKNGSGKGVSSGTDAKEKADCEDRTYAYEKTATEDTDGMPEGEAKKDGVAPERKKEDGGSAGNRPDGTEREKTAVAGKKIVRRKVVKIARKTGAGEPPRKVL